MSYTHAQGFEYLMESTVQACGVKDIAINELDEILVLTYNDVDLMLILLNNQG